MRRLAAVGGAPCLLAGAVCVTPLEFSPHRVDGMIAGMMLVRFMDGEMAAASSLPRGSLS